MFTRLHSSPRGLASSCGYNSETRDSTALNKLTSLAHIFGGFLTALVSVSNPALAALMTVLFLVYELNEDWYLTDEAFRDIKEFIIGLFIGALVEFLRWLTWLK